MIRMILILLAGSFLVASGVSAQQPGRQQGDTMMMRGGPMTREMMMSVMDSADARLDRLVSTMNKSTGSRRIQAMAAVINELVAQRKMMRTHAQMMMRPGTGGGRHMQKMRPAAPDTADRQP